MKTKLLIAVLAVYACSLVGCTSGARYGTVVERIPTLQENQGRILFYRGRNRFGSAVQPDIRLNGEIVGKYVPGGFFFVDRPAGNYEVSCMTPSAKYTLTLTLAAKETRYVRAVVTRGAFVVHVQPVLEDEEQAMKTLAESLYTGYPL